MNQRAIRYFLGNILRVEAAFLLPPALLSWIKGEWSSLYGFGVTILLLIAASFLLCIRTKGNRQIFAREGFVITALSWILMSFFGALPFFLSGYIPSLIDAWFETVSGFTTTGSTILTDVEVLPMGLLYWRSFTHWLGGMGVLVFLLAILPMAGSNGRASTLHILKAESPGPITGKFTPKLRQSVTILYLIYIGMTVLEVILLLAGGMPFFDALTTSFGTAGTGGFSIKNASIAAYDSYYLQTVVAVFMMLFGVNFNIYYLLLMGQFRRVAKNEELRLYLIILLFSTVAIAFNILPQFSSFYDALHHSFFQVSSIMTTTGFSTINFDLWPQFSRMLLLALMIVGACAGSTGGGFKVSRLLVLVKYVNRAFRKMIHPRVVELIRLDGKTLDTETVDGVLAFSAAYFFVTIVSTMLVSLNDLSLETSLTGVLACMNNIGPGLDLIGPIGNYSMFSPLSKLVLSLDMLLGRLEIFPMMILLVPAMWKR